MSCMPRGLDKKNSTTATEDYAAPNVMAKEFA